MDRSQVAEHYRARGYQIRENAKLRGKSGNIHGVELVAEGPLGALLISFGDVAGVDAPEMSSIRRIARDVGATPVVAAASFTNELRRLAPQLGVVLVDDATLAQPAPATPPSTWPAATPPDPQAGLEAHPWPASGRYKPADPTRAGKAVEVDDMLAQLGEKPARPAGVDLWPIKQASGPEGTVVLAAPETGPAAAAEAFSWLGQPVQAEANTGLIVEEDAVDETTTPAARRIAMPIAAYAPKRWVLRTLLYAFATAFFLWLFLR